RFVEPARILAIPNVAREVSPGLVNHIFLHNVLPTQQHFGAREPRIQGRAKRLWSPGWSPVRQDLHGEAAEISPVIADFEWKERPIRVPGYHRGCRARGSGS